jgi:methylated-DNA-protein-cysteine methyltransferase-like protein
MSPTFARIRQVVAKIPKGRVMTYGDVALSAGMPRAARVVGYAMHSLGETVPWQRVLGRRNARNGHLTIKDPQARARQRRLLEAEGVTFSASGAVDLLAFGWLPLRRAPREKSSAARPTKRRRG